MKPIFVTMLLIALIMPASAISVSVAGNSGGNDYATTSQFALDEKTTLDMQSSQGLTAANIKGAGFAETDGVGIAAGSPDSEIAIQSNGQDTVISEGGRLAGAVIGDSAYESEALNADGTATISGPAITATGGNANAYYFSGRKWTTRDPQIKISVNAAGGPLTQSQMQSAVSAAAETWDAATNQNLFSDGGAVATTAVQGKYDRQNVVSFLKYNTGCTALASAGTWYRIYKPGGYTRYAGTFADPYPIVESDIAFNTNYKWTTTGEAGKIDFQSVALHEMGHTIGLSDLYNKLQFKTDTRQVMHYYTGKKWTLGNGDATGVWKLYG